MDDSRLAALRQSLAARTPRTLTEEAVQGALHRAAVSLLLRPVEDDLQILLIERPVSPLDPWSGHMAFPGGRRKGDEDHIETAVREMHEEVGIDLGAIGAHLGRLDDLKPTRGGPQIAVAAFVFAVPRDVVIAADPREVAQTFWVPLAHLIDPRQAVEHLHPLADGGRLGFPGIAYHDHVIWGLTYRMLMQFLEVARAADLGSAP